MEAPEYGNADAYKSEPGQDLIDYISATAGPDGEMPFNSPLGPRYELCARPGQ